MIAAANILFWLFAASYFLLTAVAIYALVRFVRTPCSKHK